MIAIQSTTEKIRRICAIFFVAIMIISMFSVGFVGTTVATDMDSVGDSITNEEMRSQHSGLVDRLIPNQIKVPKSEWDNQILWRGQQVSMNLTDPPEDSIDVRKVTKYDDSGVPTSTVLTQVVGIVDGNVTISTESLSDEGIYVLTSGGEYLQSDGTWGGGIQESGMAEVVAQDLYVEFGQGEVQNIGEDSTVDVAVDSNRARFSVEISGERNNAELSDTEIRDIFGSTTLDIQGEDSFEMDFAGKNPGEYTFTFNVEDSTAQTTSEIDVFGEIIGPNGPPKYNLSLDNDGSTYSIAFPGPVNESYNEMFSHNMDGIKAVYHFNSEDKKWNLMSGTDFNNSPNSLDTIVILTEGGEEPNEIPITIEFEVQDPPQPSQKDLSEGWNFVGASTFDDVDTVLDRGSAEATVALDQFAEPEVGAIAEVNSFQHQTRLPHYDLSSGNPPTMSPFKGYFLFVTDSGSLPSLLSGVKTRQEADYALNTTASPS